MKNVKNFMNTKIIINFTFIGFAFAVSNAQIPRSAFEEIGVSSEITQAAKVVLPDTPDVGTNNQNITVAPVFQPGNTSFSNSGQPAAPGTSGPANNTGSQSEEVLADKLRHFEIDPANDSVIDTKRGAVWNLGDNRIADARFERYLNLDAAENKHQEEYLADLNELLQLVCPKNPYASRTSLAPDRAALAKAYTLLRQLSANELDHGISTVIANEVDAAHAAEADRKHLYVEVEKIEKEIERIEWNLGVTVRSRASRLDGDPNKRAPEARAAKTAVAVQETSPYTRKLAQQQALQATKYAQAEAKQLLAKADFQALLVQLFAQRRFQHVLIAAAFYRTVFGDGELDVKTEGKVKEVLTKGGAPLTVSTLESTTTDVILDIRQGVDAVKNMLASKRLNSGEKRLIETHFFGEHLPEMQTFPTASRNQILAYRQARREVAKAIEVKDYTRAKEKNSALVEMASDYDPAPVQSVFSAAEAESNFHLAKARNAATAGDKATMETEVKAAATIWPQNPALTEGAGRMMDQFDLQEKSLKELDELLAANNLRAIEAKREIFTASVATDEKRQEYLRTALNELLGIEKALERAKEFDLRGSAAEAWVVVEAEARRHPSDPKLTAAVFQYSAQAPEFVKHLTFARKAQDQPVKAIHQYLAALQFNPACDEAKEQIAKLAAAQLDSLN